MSPVVYLLVRCSVTFVGSYTVIMALQAPASFIAFVGFVGGGILFLCGVYLAFTAEWE